MALAQLLLGSSEAKTATPATTKKRAGGKMSGHAYGTWNIPPLIRDEEIFRLERSNKQDASAITIT
uniref:Uncharacterized protein n=1 Tax=Oryza brachyantha TaxID=4533 RepID=J3LYF2_ORYBR